MDVTLAFEGEWPTYAFARIRCVGSLVQSNVNIDDTGDHSAVCRYAFESMKKVRMTFELS